MAIKKQKTDWTKYYNTKKNFFSTFTQQFTLQKIVSAYEYSCKNCAKSKIIELGGGNSCFVDAFCSLEEIQHYDIIDNNDLALSLFENKMKKSNIKHMCYKQDLTLGIPEKTLHEKYDFVYSVGLIEHFTPQEVESVIEAHFSLAKDGGAVFITFPIPTFKYRFCRKIMELLHVWIFYDEVPVSYKAIKPYLEKYGTIAYAEVNSRLFLTQLCVLTLKNR